MGTIRMVMLDGLAVADLLSLRQGGFFDGAVMTLPAGVTGQEATLRPVAPAAPAPATVSSSGAQVTPDQRELLTQIKQDVAAYQEATGTLPLPSAPLPEFAEVVTPVSAEPEPVAVSAPIGPVTVDALAACTKLRDVLQLLIESGMPASDLAAYLESVREQVPLLQRISNIGERVARTLSVMGQGG